MAEIGYAGFSLRELSNYMKGIKYFKFFAGSDGAALTRDAAKVRFPSGQEKLLMTEFQCYFKERAVFDSEPNLKRFHFDKELFVEISEFDGEVILTVKTMLFRDWNENDFNLLLEIDHFIDNFSIKPLENSAGDDKAFVPLKD